MKTKLTLLLYLVISSVMYSQDISIYDIDPYEISKTESIAFISLSDNYPLSEHPDSLAIPDQQGKSIKEIEHFKLEGKYRKRFLDKMKISGTDNVFIYDYASDLLVALPVKDLSVVACLNYYVSAEEGPFTQEYYMIGFEVKKSNLKGFKEYYTDAFAYVGKEQPFARGKMKPLRWKKIETKDVPVVKIDPDHQKILLASGGGNYWAGADYKYEAEGYTYYVREIVNKENETFARRLLVMNTKTGKVVLNRFYYNSEGTSLAPLNYTTKDENYFPDQWTGQLFKNKPPVVLGFHYISFGCPDILFLDPLVKAIEISCDNRH